MRRSPLTVLSTSVLVVLLAGCGSSGGDAPAAAPAADSTAVESVPASSSPATQPSATEPPAPETLSTGPAATEPPAGAQGDPPPAATQPAATTQPAPSVVWPDEQCSSENAGVAQAVSGPAPALALRSESANSPLPDVAVRRLNCGPAWVNLKNEVPADRPLLVWFWAPH